MIRRLVDRFMNAEAEIKASLALAQPEGYDALVKRVIEVITAETYDEDGGDPDPERITIIDHGDFQGTKLYIIGAKGYQPEKYWSIFVNYGSCSGCDAFESIRGYSDDPPTETQISDYWTMMLHMVQSMHPVECGSPDHVPFGT